VNRLAVCALLGFLAVGVTDARLDADSAAPTPPPVPTHFSHKDHATYGADTTDAKKCGSCHTIDAKGAVQAPASLGHAPCLTSGCHADSFLRITKKNSESKDPRVLADFAKASAFCLGCHEQVPWAWRKPTMRVLQGWLNQREHHIEMAKSATSNMDHFAHAVLARNKAGQRAACRDCHVVGNDFALVKGTPGHAQCLSCHNPTDNVAFPLAECGRCHVSGSKEEWLRKVVEANGVKLNPKFDVLKRPGTDVYSCGSQAEDLYKKQGKKSKFCFRHETEGHRTAKGADVQCEQCHFVITKKNEWGGRAYNSIADLHLNKVIGNPNGNVRDPQHEACSGSTSCHKHQAQVDLNSAGSDCSHCHAKRTKEEPF
jgi:hypothetical protein